MSSSVERHNRLDDALEEYFRAVDAGAHLDADDLVARYPEVADDIRDFLAAQVHIKPLAVNDDATFHSKQLKPDSDSTKVRMHGSHKPLDSSRFGDYEVISEIARGGMGVVYKAYQHGAKRLVAIKTLLVDAPVTSETNLRFRTEAEAASQLDHPNIVPIHEVGTIDGRPFFSMKLIEGGSLADHRSDFYQNLRVSAQLIATVADAVHYAHQHGILHRDLKPGNILLERGRSLTSVTPSAETTIAAHVDRLVPYVSDFGLAKRLDAEVTLTETGAIIGTPNYMSPEQAAGVKALTTGTDIYSLGAILYELITGRKPFVGGSPVDILTRVRHEDPDRPTTLNKNLDRDLETICLKCLQKEPKDRYESAGDLAEDLRRWLAGDTILARAPRTWERILRWSRRNPAVSSLTAALVLLVLSALAVTTSLWLVAEKERDISRQLVESERHQRELALTAERYALDALKQARESESKAKLQEQDALNQAENARRAANIANAMVAKFDQFSYRFQYEMVKLCMKYQDKDQAIQTLYKTNPKLRGWEFDYLSRFYRDKPHELEIKNVKWPLTNVQFHPEKPELVAIDADQMIRRWDYRTGKSLELPWNLAVKPTCLAIDPRGKYIAIGTSIAIFVFSYEEGEVRHCKMKSPTRALTFHPSMDVLAYVHDTEDTVCAWTFTDRKAATRKNKTTHAVTTLQFSPTSEYLACVGQNKVTILDPDTWIPKGPAVGPEGAQIDGPSNNDCFWAQHHCFTALMNFNNLKARLWSANCRVTPIKAVDHFYSKATYRSAAITKDRKRVATILPDFRIEIYDSSSPGTEKETFLDLQFLIILPKFENAQAVRFSPDGHYLLVFTNESILVLNGSPEPAVKQQPAVTP